MKTYDIEIRLDHKGVKATANRVNVYRALDRASHPVSMGELEQSITTMDKSSIFRVLTIFQQHDVVHTIDDGSGALKYELCRAESCCDGRHMHVHFYCERCQTVSCLEELPVPQVALPAGYTVHTVNHIIKGICPDCQRT